MVELVSENVLSVEDLSCRQSSPKVHRLKPMLRVSKVRAIQLKTKYMTTGIILNSI